VTKLCRDVITLRLGVTTLRLGVTTLCRGETTLRHGKKTLCYGATTLRQGAKKLYSSEIWEKSTSFKKVLIPMAVVLNFREPFQLVAASL
jgi:hypothetical protein